MRQQISAGKKVQPVQMFTARTSEVDDIDLAVRELLALIDLPARDIDHCGGLFFCHLDFVDSGVATALCQALPFPVMGMTSMTSADGHGYSQYDFCLTVLEDPALTFYGGISPPVDADNYEAEVDALYTRVRAQSGVDPSLIFTFIPYLRDVSGAEMVAAMDAACGGLPMWGSVTNGIDFNYEQVSTVYGGVAERKGVGMLFVCGPLKPRFVVCSLPDSGVGNVRARITKSDGCMLYELNGLTVADYLESIGLNVSQANITTTPLMVYYEGDDDPVALGLFTAFDDGSALAGGPMPEGVSLSVGSISQATVMQSAQDGLRQILADTDRQATLLLPCVTRFIMLAPDQESELRLIYEALSAENKPFMMGYSGGEVCPMRGRDGTLHNRFHNYTFCACLL
jgi:hypothetical protein